MRVGVGSWGMGYGVDIRVGGRGQELSWPRWGLRVRAEGPERLSTHPSKTTGNLNE